MLRLFLSTALLVGTYSGGYAEAAPTKNAAKTASARPAKAKSPTEALLAPRSAWVVPLAAPAPNPALAKEPVQILLIDSQIRLTPELSENYVQTVILAQNQVGAQALSTFAMPWQPDANRLRIHSLKIVRGSETIDVLDPAQIRIVQNENKLSSSTITGVQIATMPIRALQTGDRLVMEISYLRDHDTLVRPGDRFNITPKPKIGLASWSLQVDQRLGGQWGKPQKAKVEETTSDGFVVKRVQLRNYEPAKEIAFLPDRLKHDYLQYSAAQAWAEVVRPMAPFYQDARRIAAASPIKTLATQIAAKHSRPEDRMLAALRATQDQVRYVAMLLSEGRYHPDSADKVWDQRYGDCKGKTALLLALLDELKIEAEPVLVSVENDAGILPNIPLLDLLDHVFVRAKVGGQYYYLDGTNLGQRTVDELRQASVRNGVLVNSGELVRFPDLVPTQPLVETRLNWDASQVMFNDVPFKARLILRGSVAAAYRVLAQGGSEEKDFLDKVKGKVVGVDNDDLKLVASNPDEPDGSYSFDFEGKADLDWRPVENKKGNRWSFSNSVLIWNVDFERDEKTSAVPVELNTPYWERAVETIALPDNGRDYWIDGKPIDRTVAGVMFHRDTSLEGGRAISTTDFKRMTGEISGKDAIAAKSAIDEISDDYVEVVARKKLKLPPSDD